MYLISAFVCVGVRACMRACVLLTSMFALNTRVVLCIAMSACVIHYALILMLSCFNTHVCVCACVQVLVYIHAECILNVSEWFFRKKSSTNTSTSSTCGPPAQRTSDH